MDILAAYKFGITVLIPVFSALTCGALVALSLGDCLSQEERRLKKIMLVYLSLSALGWYMAFCYEFHPVLFTWLNVLCLLSFVLPPIFFYRIIRYLTRLGLPERFSSLHYLLPGLLAGVMFVWSLFVPMEVQIEIVEGKALVFPAGYETFTRFFILKPLLRVIFGMTYYILTIAVLVRFYKRTSEKTIPARRIAGWIAFLVGISIASLLSSLLPTFMPRATILHSIWTLLAAVAIAFQHVLLSYHIIRRKYRLYGIPQSGTVQGAVSQTETAPQITPRIAMEPQTVIEMAEATNLTQSAPEPETKPQRRHHSGKLSRVRLEAYFRNEKPWLDPDCKIADLVEVFDVNRTALSGFINRTYGMNFNRYLNRWRIRELDRLRSLPSNHGKSMRSLVEKAGFDNYRTYLRASAAQRNAEEKQPGKKKGGTL